LVPKDGNGRCVGPCAWRTWTVYLFHSPRPARHLPPLSFVNRGGPIRISPAGPTHPLTTAEFCLTTQHLPRGGGAQKRSEAGYGRPVDRGAWTAKTVKTTPATTSTSSIRQLLGAAHAQTAHPAASSTAPTHQPLGSAIAETTPAGAPAAAADRKQRPDATCEGKNG
jgi:hypothetical protein